jgi:hypothetical protein
MKKFVIMLAVLPLATAALAAGPTGNPTVQWRGMAGVITAQGVDNPVSANISSGTFAWTARSGQAQADLHNGAIDFSVDGLVINGTQFSGTPGPVTAVTGTLVCSPGTADEAAHDTPQVPLNAKGNAVFSGFLAGFPAGGAVECPDPVFLIRIAQPAGAAGRWIATGTQRMAGTGY